MKNYRLKRWKYDQCKIASETNDPICEEHSVSCTGCRYELSPVDWDKIDRDVQEEVKNSEI